MRIPDEIYKKVVRAMPIPCVDLVVSNRAGEILLVRRTNEPARGQWWFPGGRVHLGETREVAARRQLFEECGLQATDVEELWTCDVILPVESDARISHGITTLYTVSVGASSRVILDKQASEFAWQKPSIWRKEPLHPLMAEILFRFQTMSPKGDKITDLTP
jgi:colanic acid biosynthesis protein WcaH